MPNRCFMSRSDAALGGTSLPQGSRGPPLAQPSQRLTYISSAVAARAHFEVRHRL